MDGVLNETTKTVHKHRREGQGIETPCGVTHLLARDQLRTITVSEAVSEFSADRCGRCFEDAGGY